ncbi:MAG: ATP-binding protein [Gemmatimonadaceae bacterium]|nr:ATP-binding protein [Gemmatimonadaceae bacterium]
MPSITSVPNDLVERFIRLQLPHTSANLEKLLSQADEEKWSRRELLDRLTEQELRFRIQRNLDDRLSRSRLGRHKLMADFDWNWPRKIDRSMVERALSSEFIVDGRNLILLGPNGAGKTMLAKNIARQAIFAGFSTLFYTAAELLDLLAGDSAELRRKRLRDLTQPWLLVIDELGYLAYDDRAADLLFLLLDARYKKRRSVIVTTNLRFQDWQQVFPNATCVVTLVDRLTHHADLLPIDALSFRSRESREEAQKRNGDDERS